mmetsp:Transcript_23254/g.35204  ORF Transcript_23254/g.35204 Transcript_23254/m.35204 type:complete len:509 (+) Transcript_23254:767-2293(+)
MKGSNSSVTSSGTNKRRQQNDIRLYVHQALSADELEITNKYLLELIVDAGLPFSFVERPSFFRFVNSIRSMTAEQLPSRKKLRNILLPKVAELVKNHFETNAKNKIEKGHCGGLILDGYKNVSGQHIESIIVSVGGVTFPLGLDACGTEHDGLAVARTIEGLLKKHSDKYKIKYVCTDDAGQCGRARQILALRYPHLVFMRCYAYQVNLMVCALLKCQLFQRVSKEAVAAAKAITASSSKWLPKLVDTVVSCYGNVASKVLVPAETRWNSMQGCFGSQLRIRSACRMFAVKYSTGGIPAPLKKWESASFWSDLKTIELVIRPFCHASYLMQRECNNLAHIMLLYLNLTLFIIKISLNWQDSSELLKDIEQRWKKEENPLFLLASLLHPTYRSVAAKIISISTNVRGNWRRQQNPLTLQRLKAAACFYYCKFRLNADVEDSDDEMSELKDQLEDWYNDTLEVQKYKPERHDVVQWWLSHKAENTELSKLATFLLGVKVQLADCERHFKD